MTDRLRILLYVAMVLTTSFTACGAREAAVVRVGRASITRAMVNHWMSIMAPRRSVSALPRYNALGFLIASHWWLGEAADRGIKVSDRAVRKRLDEKIGSFPGGKHEFEASIKAIRRTVPDIELELRVELALAKLEQSLARHEPPVAAAQIATYYKRHISSFEHRERRVFYIVENLASKAVALRTKKEISRGKNMAGISLHESLERPMDLHKARAIVKAIFMVDPHTVSAPVAVNDLYFLVEVTHIQPAEVQTLAESRVRIEKKLAKAKERETLAHFLEAWRRKWTARTDCSPEYVVQRCKQYTGPTVQEEPLSLP